MVALPAVERAGYRHGSKPDASPEDRAMPHKRRSLALAIAYALMGHNPQHVPPASLADRRE